MTRLKALDPAQATGKTKEMFTTVQSKLGVVPNMMKTMANSPALLEGYLNLSGALGKGKISGKIGELIAVTVAERNSCGYCLAAHNFIGQNLLKISPDALDHAKTATSEDTKTQGLLKFAAVLVDKKGLISDTDFKAAKDAGLSDEEISEVVGHVALNILTNYFNNAAATENEFKLPESVEKA